MRERLDRGYRRLLDVFPDPAHDNLPGRYPLGQC
jgi:hypothetical protein